MLCKLCWGCFVFIFRSSATSYFCLGEETWKRLLVCLYTLNMLIRLFSWWMVYNRLNNWPDKCNFLHLGSERHCGCMVIWIALWAIIEKEEMQLISVQFTNLSSNHNHVVHCEKCAYHAVCFKSTATFATAGLVSWEYLSSIVLSCL